MSKPDWHQTKSTQIKAIAHDPQTKTLFVHFKNGGLYEYHTVEHEKFEAMKGAESAGKFLGAEIKGKHSFRKITDAAEIMELTIEDREHIETKP